ncbi:hypothetical protein LVJ94_10560 [Pendulispora rubella]|uniref:Uncharacterized protein n=1 Tax=Pendulispora rubella TaxID=2741070 RepID=A0ABZ2L9S1_9BACT
MFSLRSASLVGSFVFAAFGLMACAAQGVGQPQTGASIANYDPSSVYQPSPNSRPLAVAPPVTVTGGVGNAGLPERAQTGASFANYDPSSVYQPSPNSRPLAVAPPVTVTGAVEGGSLEGGNRTAHCTVAGEGSVGVSPNARLCP